MKLTVRKSNGRPYYSIIYLEDGNEFEGYSSYSLDVISDYLKRYFEFAQPECKTGRWIYDDNDWSSVRGECSVCGWKAHVGEDDVVGMDYCPNCGSRLLIGKDGECDE